MGEGERLLPCIKSLLNNPDPTMDGLGLPGIRKGRQAASLRRTPIYESERVKVLVAHLCLRLVTPWTVARQAPLSMDFSRQEYWSG